MTDEMTTTKKMNMKKNVDVVDIFFNNNGEELVKCFNVYMHDGNKKLIKSIFISINDDGSVFSSSIYDHTKGCSSTRYVTENENGTLVEIFERRG